MKTGAQGVDRRHLLRLAGAAASTLWLPRSAWSQARVAGDPFTLGVASGSPAPDSVVLWTRLVSPGLFQPLPRGPVTVRWEVAHDERFTRIAQRGQAQALPELAHSVHVEAGGLEPDRWYFYRFMAGDAVSPTGRMRTFPLPEAAVSRLRVAYASCNRWEHGYFSGYGHLARENLDAVLFLGDYIYEYPNAANPVRTGPGHWTLNLDSYRDRYALHKGDAHLQAAHAACPWIVTWDDHEVQNDYAGVHAGDSGPPQGDFLARRAAAYQAFYEHMPLRASVLTRAMVGLASGAEMRIYGQLRFGRLANLYLLDARQYKDALVCSKDGKPGSSYVDPATCPQWDDPARSMLGPQQERWLDGALARGEANWNIVAHQTLFGERDARAGGGRFLWNDGWDGYGAARRRLTDSLRKNAAANPVFIGGDVHENWVGHVQADYADARSAAIGTEFCGTSMTSRSSANPRTQERLAWNRHFVFADSQRRGYGVAEFTPGRLETTLRVVDDVTQPVTKIETLAKFAVEAGRAVVERA